MSIETDQVCVGAVVLFCRTFSSWNNRVNRVRTVGSVPAEVLDTAELGLSTWSSYTERRQELGQWCCWSGGVMV